MLLNRLALIASLIFLLQGCLSDVTAIGSSQLRVAHAYTVRPDILAIRIETGKTVYGQQVPYKSQPGDSLSDQKPQGDVWVKRGVNYIGTLVGKKKDTVYTFDRYEGTRLDTNWAMRQDSYRIVSNDDRNYARGTRPKAIYRKTKPTDMARVDQWKFDWPLAHVLYLKLPHALQAGKTYQVNFSGGNVANLSFRYEPEAIRSEAIHVSHLGFRPDDPAKVAFLSTWMGNGGGLDYRQGLTFWVIDQKTNQKVYTGTTKLSKASKDIDDPRNRNYNYTDVYLMDFTSFQQPGEYRVCADSIGCSFPFKISQDVWKNPFFVSARGLYHQRSGIELSPPYTTVKRPRAFHPDDGVIVYQSNARLMDTDMGIGKQDAFSSLIKAKTKEQVPNAWGGYFDAGDWDRRIQHLEVSRLLLELGEMFPKYFEDVNLNIPESKNSLPDIIDEALWSLDFYKRLQTPAGGIRGGIESAAHPKYGEASWQESLDVMAYAPDIWSSYIYAGVAARAANLLAPRFPKLAMEYRNSGLRAMEYAEREYAKSKPKAIPQEVIDSRNLAAVELLRLTGDKRWHKIFLQTTVYTDPRKEIYGGWGSHNQRDAAFLYARLENSQVDSQVQKNAVNALLREADMSANLGANTGFKWTKMHPYEPICWGNSFGSPKTVTLLRAHFLTGKVDYLKASVLASQFSAGANPDNMTYTTGLGYSSPEHPLLIDQRVMGESPPPGITVFGPLDMVQFNDYWTMGIFKDVTFPSPWEWPTAEGYFDIYLFPAVTEFTVMTIAPTAYTWGYLAARSSIDKTAIVGN